MLNARHRLRHSADFAMVLRRGARAGRPALVVHVLLADGAVADGTPAEPPAAESTPADQPARVGFVVPKSVGNSVHRNLVVRRLRALLAARLDRFPPGSRLVIRALPAAAAASSSALAEQLDSALSTAVRRASGAGRPAGARP